MVGWGKVLSKPTKPKNDDALLQKKATAEKAVYTIQTIVGSKSSTREGIRNRLYVRIALLKLRLNRKDWYLGRTDDFIERFLMPVLIYQKEDG